MNINTMPEIFLIIFALFSRNGFNPKPVTTIVNMMYHNPSMVEIDVDKAVAWLDKGAQPSERAQKILEISGAWAQWRSTKGEVVPVPQAPEEKIKSSSKANKKQQEENLDEENNNESSEESSDKEEE